MGRGWPCLQGSELEGAGGGRDSHLPLFPEEFTVMLGADAPGGRRQGVSEGPQQPHPLRRCPSSQPLWP